MTSQICKKVPKHQMGNVIAPNTSGKQKKLPRQRFKEVNPATIKYPHERATVMKHQSGGSAVDPKLMEYLRSKGYPQGAPTQPSIEQGRDKVKPTREQAKAMKIKKALSTAGTGLQDLGTNVLTMGTQLRKPTEDEIKRGRGTWGDRAPVIAGAVTAGVANELTAGGMGYLAGKIVQRGAGKVVHGATKALTAEAAEVTPKSIRPGLLDKSTVKSTPWSMDIGNEASPNMGDMSKRSSFQDIVARMKQNKFNLVKGAEPKSVKNLSKAQEFELKLTPPEPIGGGWGPNIRKPGQVTEVPWPKIHQPNSPAPAQTLTGVGKNAYHHPQIVDINGKRFGIKNTPSIIAPNEMTGTIIRENSFAGDPLVTENNIYNVLGRLKKNTEGSFIKRSHINQDHAFLEKVAGEYEREMPSITSELHQQHRAITPVHQSMLLTSVDPKSRLLANSNLQVQKTAPGKYLYQSGYDNLTNDAIEEAREALEAGRKAGLRFDFNGSNNTLYDAKANKFSFIDMGLAPRHYNVNNPLHEFNKHLIKGIERNSPVSIRDFVRQRGLSAISYKEGGEIEKE